MFGRTTLSGGVGLHERISLTINCHLYEVEVSYIYMPFARIAGVWVFFTYDPDDDDDNHDPDDDDDDDHDHDDDDDVDHDRSSSPPDAYIYGKITAHYNSAIVGSDSPPLIFFDIDEKQKEKHGQVHYGVPINLSRSFVCIPCYSSLSLKLDNLVFNKPTAKDEIVFSEDMKYTVSGSPPDVGHISKNNVCVYLRPHWFTTDKLEIVLAEENNLKLKRAPILSIPKTVLPQSIVGWYRIQLLSFFVGHGGEEQVDIRGTVEVKHVVGRELFKMDKGCPGNLFSGKAPSLQGLTSYLPVTSYTGFDFTMIVNLKDVGSRHVDIHNAFSIEEYDYLFLPGKWFNRPLCYVIFGNKGFAPVHFIIFKSAVKATVNIFLVLKDSNAPCSSGSVYGTLVAQYSNCKYLTNYHRKYWSIDLLEKKEKDAQSLSKDGQISLLRDVISVPTDSYLILVADLYRRSGSAGTCGLGGSDDHLVNKVEIRIGDVESRIEGQTWDVVVRTKWESGEE